MPDSPRLRFSLYALFIAACTVAAYWPALHGNFIWDDDEYVTHNPLLTAADGLKRIWFSLDSPSQYFPLVYTTFRFERALWGLDPTGYHWVNLILHIGNALLLWKLLQSLKVPGAPLAALIFALHPVHVESVAWITERKNVLMGFFFLLTLLSWNAFIAESTKRRWLYYTMALAACVLALSAKTTACTLFVAMLLVLWLRDKQINWRRMFQIAPFALLGLSMGLVAVWWERYHQGTRGELFSISPIERLLVAGRSLWFYLFKLVWPEKLTFIYPRWDLRATDPLAYGWLLAGLGLLVAIYFGRRFLGRGVEVAALFFIVTLGPLLGFIMLYTFRYTFVADHYQYLASIGPIALAAAAVSRLNDRAIRRREFLIFVTLLATAACGILTWRQSHTYRDMESLWRNTIKNNPACWMAYNNLGIALFGKGEVDEAIREYGKSLALRPDYAQAHYNLGTALLQKQRTNEAMAECRRALELEPKDSDAHVALGNALLSNGDLDGAITQYWEALELRPDSSDAHYNLANALSKKGNAQEAIAHYEKAIAAAPDLVDAYFGMGNMLLEQRRDREAIACYEKALQIVPHFEMVQNNLAWILASSADQSIRDGARAIKLADEARRTTGGDSLIILHTLAAAYAQNGEFNRAIETAEHALELAVSQKETDLAAELRREISLYKSGSSYQDH